MVSRGVRVSDKEHVRRFSKKIILKRPFLFYIIKNGKTVFILIKDNNNNKEGKFLCVLVIHFLEAVLACNMCLLRNFNIIINTYIL